MNHREATNYVGRRLESFLDADGHIAMPDGLTLTAAVAGTVAALGDTVGYRYLDYGPGGQPTPVELTWARFGVRMRAVAARLQQVSAAGDRVAVLAPQGVEYVVGFFAAIAAGTVAVPLFTPELPGQAERLAAVLADAEPAVVLTTTAAADAVRVFLHGLPPRARPRVIAIDAVPDPVGDGFRAGRPTSAGADDVAYLQYTSGSTRTPAGVEITHRCVITNVIQMVLAVGLDWDSHGVSWLPLFHDMGLLMILFPALCGGQITLMSPVAFVRRPGRWLHELARQPGRTFAAAPNFAFDLAAGRAVPRGGETLDLSNIAGLINGSEPVSPATIERFTAAFAPYGLSRTAVRPSYGMAEATLFVSSVAPGAAPRAVSLDRGALGAGRAVPVDPDAPTAMPVVSCGRVARSLWAVIVDADTEAELPDGRVGEIWLHGDNIGRGYFRRPRESGLAFGNKLQSRREVGSHAEGAAVGGTWFRTGDLGMYLDGELYITGRSKDLVIVDGRNHYPQDIEATVAATSPAVRAGYVAAFAVSGATGERPVVVAERAPAAGRADPAAVVAAIRAAVSRRHGLALADVRLVSAGRLPRTTSGKLKRHACRDRYLAGEL